MISSPPNRFFSSIHNSTEDHANVSVIRMVFRSLAVVLGLLHTYAAIKSQSMNADGIAYLDIGDAYFQGDWATAINAVWSPLYSWILGGVNFLFKPSMQWEFPVVHLVNFAIYLFALASFEFMWSKTRRMDTQPASQGLSGSSWWSLGYLLFIWTSLSLIQIWSVTPDMLMAAFLFLAAGQVARIRSGDLEKRTFLLLGLFLGLGYLSKAFMFLISLIFLACAWLVQKEKRAAADRTLLAVGMFLLVSLPFILLISDRQGRLTVSEAGMVTYVRHVVGIPYPHWQGNTLENIVPAHPSRLVHSSPFVYEFGEPIGGTYPITTDPAYWYAGINVPANLSYVLTPLFNSGLFYADLFFQRQGVFLACVAALYALMPWKKMGILDALNRWVLVIPAVLAFGSYGLVLVADRYIGAFILLFWTDILANIQLPAASDNKSMLKVLSSIAAIGLMTGILFFNLEGVKRLTPTLETGSLEQSAPPAGSLAVAQSLADLGIQPGDKVGVIGYAYDSFWARLARVKIVAEMLAEDADEFWRGGTDLRQSVLESFNGTRAKAVIAEDVPVYAQMNGWHRVGDSSTYIYIYK